MPDLAAASHAASRGRGLMVAGGYFYVTNTVSDPGLRPNIPDGITWVGNTYEKTGNVRKYVVVTGTTITGHPGVFGPIKQSDLDDVLNADGATFRGFTIKDVGGWSVRGIRGHRGWHGTRGTGGGASSGKGVVT